MQVLDVSARINTVIKDYRINCSAKVPMGFIVSVGCLIGAHLKRRLITGME